MGTAQRSLPVDPSSLYGQGMVQSKPGIGNAGMLSDHLEDSKIQVKGVWHTILKGTNNWTRLK